MTNTCKRCGQTFESRDVPAEAGLGTQKQFGKLISSGYVKTKLVSVTLCNRCIRRGK